MILCQLGHLFETPAASYTCRFMANSILPTVTVVIPVHNEAAFLPEALPRLFDELETVDADVTVVIAENGSTDATADLVREAMATYSNLDVLELPTPDYGAAMRDGFLQADTQWVANFDIDYFSGEFLTNALALSEVADIVLASKRAEGADDQRTVTRRFATWTFNQILKFASGVRRVRYAWHEARSNDGRRRHCSSGHLHNRPLRHGTRRQGGASWLPHRRASRTR